MRCSALYRGFRPRAAGRMSAVLLIPDRFLPSLSSSSLRFGRCSILSSGVGEAGGANAAPCVVHYSKLGMDGFTDIKFNTAVDTLLEQLETKVDALESTVVEDVTCSGGVLTLETVGKGTFILNKQAPNVQLWLSSPLSGPHHYDMVTATEGGLETVQWKSDPDGHDLVQKLEKELSEVLGIDFQLH